MYDVFIHSPFSRQSSQGNSVTADRLGGILRGNGFAVGMEPGELGGSDARCLIALNARRSAEVVECFQSSHPVGAVIVILTGTDINHPEMDDSGSPTRRTMAAADALVVLHEAELVSVPAALREKTHVIYPSVDLPEELRHRACHGSPLRVVMAGNIRAEKNTGLAVEASDLMGEEVEVFIKSYGEAPAAMAEEMRLVSAGSSHFQWCGKIAHAGLMEEMQRAHLLLNTSTQEGGANAICEAVCLGLPVLASGITGNMGMLGEGYAGYFPSGDARALADLLLRAAGDSEFYETLRSQVSARAPVFAYGVESAAWRALVTSHLP